MSETDVELRSICAGLLKTIEAYQDQNKRIAEAVARAGVQALLDKVQMQAEASAQVQTQMQSVEQALAHVLARAQQSPAPKQLQVGPAPVRDEPPAQPALTELLTELSDAPAAPGELSERHQVSIEGLQKALSEAHQKSSAAAAAPAASGSGGRAEKVAPSSALIGDGAPSCARRGKSGSRASRRPR